MPSSRLRYMFSIMTMASSTTKPTDTASAISDRLLIENPATHIAAQVPASASGTEMPAAMVGVIRRTNTNTTSMTRNAVASSVHSISSTLARMVPVRSERMEISTPPGIHCLSSGNSAFTRSTVSMTLASLLLGDQDQHRRLLVEPGDRTAVARRHRERSATSDSFTKLPLAALDHDVAELRGGTHLRIGSQRLARGPHALNDPTGPIALALTMAVRTSSVEIPARRQRTGIEARYGRRADRRR
jgi:hypothetical protein